MVIKKIAAIGAGPGGLTTLKYLKNYKATLFEKEPGPGGIWSPYHAHAWNSMRTNISKYSCEFSDFPHLPDTSLFPSKQEMHDYLLSYVKHFNLSDYIKYNTAVTHIRLIDSKWQITYVTEEKEHLEYFDSVIISSGRFSTPNMPPLAKDFRGTQIHSKEYEQNTNFTDQDVIIVGGNFSAVEIASDVAQTARSVIHISQKPSWIIPKLLTDKNKCIQPLDLVLYRREVENSSFTEKNRKNNRFFSKITGQNDIPELYIDPNSEDVQNIVISNDYLRLVKDGKINIQRSKIQKFQEDGVILENNSTIKAQTIIYCTGFKPNLEFLDDTLLKTLQYDPKDSLQPVMLYNSVFHPQLPNLFFIGMGSFQGAYFPIMELQARLAVEILSGRVNYPDKESIAKYFQKAGEIRDNDKRPQFINSSYSELVDSYAKLANLLPPNSDIETWNKLNMNPVIPSDYLLYGEGANTELAEKRRAQVIDFMKKGSSELKDTIKNACSSSFFNTKKINLTEVSSVDTEQKKHSFNEDFYNKSASKQR